MSDSQRGLLNYFRRAAALFCWTIGSFGTKYRSRLSSPEKKKKRALIVWSTSSTSNNLFVPDVMHNSCRHQTSQWSTGVSDQNKCTIVSYQAAMLKTAQERTEKESHAVTCVHGCPRHQRNKQRILDYTSAIAPLSLHGKQLFASIYNTTFYPWETRRRERLGFVWVWVSLFSLLSIHGCVRNHPVKHVTVFVYNNSQSRLHTNVIVFCLYSSHSPNKHVWCLNLSLITTRSQTFACQATHLWQLEFTPN